MPTIPGDELGGNADGFREREDLRVNDGLLGHRHRQGHHLVALLVADVKL